MGSVISRLGEWMGFPASNLCWEYRRRRRQKIQNSAGMSSVGQSDALCHLETARIEYHVI